MIVPSTKDELDELFGEHNAEYSLYGHGNGVTIRVDSARSELPGRAITDLYEIVETSGVELDVEFRY